MEQNGRNTDFQDDGRNWVVGYNHVFSPNLILSMRGGWSRLFNAGDPPVDRNINQELGLTGVDTTRPGMARFALSGFSNVGIGTAIPNRVGSETRQFITDLTWIKNKHSVKFGLNFSWVERSLLNPRESTGVFTFDGGFTRDSSTFKEGRSLADLLLGTPSSAQVSDIVLEATSAPPTMISTFRMSGASPRD